MQVIGSIRGRNHEENAGGLAIEGIEADTAGNRHGGKSGSAYALALGVRGGNAVSQSCGAGGFTGEHVLDIGFLVRQISGSFHEIRELADGRLFVGRGSMQSNAAAFEQLSDTHNKFSPLYMK